MAWDVADGITCVIYWYVQSNQGAKRLPNRLGLGCQSTRNDAKSTISKIVETSTSTKGLLTTRFFRESPYTMQHCDINFCLSGTMGTGMRVIAAIDLFPKALDDWNSNTRANTDQAEIDSLLLTSKESERNDRSAPMWNAGNIVPFVVLSIIGLVVLIVGILFLICIVMLLRLPEEDGIYFVLPQHGNR